VNRYSFFIYDLQFGQQASTIKLKGKVIAFRLNCLMQFLGIFPFSIALLFITTTTSRSFPRWKAQRIVNNCRELRWRMKAWVEEHLHEYISGSHACSIHALYCNLGQYTLFQHLSIPLHRLLHNTTKIYEYLQHH